MRLSPHFWSCVLIVLTKLGLFKPYSRWVDSFLNYLGEATESQLKEAQQWIKAQDTPSVRSFRMSFGYGWDALLEIMLEEESIEIRGRRIHLTGEEDSESSADIC